jgi:hypothetical protein
MLHDSYGLLICQVALVSSNGMAEQRLTAACLQRSLRARFRQQLKAGVAMTSTVKSGQQIFEVFMMFFVLSASAKPEPGRHDA